MTMVRTPQGSLTLKVPHSGIPALRLLQWHAKDIVLELENDKRASYVPEPTGVHPVAPAAIAR